jgi:hypothetical protein
MYVCIFLAGLGKALLIFKNIMKQKLILEVKNSFVSAFVIMSEIV